MYRNNNIGRQWLIMSGMLISREMPVNGGNNIPQDETDTKNYGLLIDALREHQVNLRF